MKRLLILIGTIVSFSSAAKDEPKYPVTGISEEMKKGMYAVIRDHELKFELNAINSSTKYYRMAITILNPKAKNYASLIVGYDKFSTIRFFKGTVYDAAGGVIKKLKQSDVYDQSAYDGVSLFSDARLKKADLSQGTYPYTVEFEYEISYKRLYDIPDFSLYHDDEISIQRQKYSIIYPQELTPRYKLFKVEEPKRIMLENKKEAMEWVFENTLPEKFEKMGPDPQYVIPNIKAAPVDFEFGGYAGKMDTWENFAKWQADLNRGRDVLSEETKQTIRELTKNATTTEEKTRILYEYLQSKTRYVGIQLGIGGLQPFEAKTVEETGYGDCKALSNYTVALLKEAGIKAYYTTIMGGDYAPAVDANFPSDQSNHIIVGVPNQKDTIWLECTSQTNPFGYLGNFTGDRYGLMITENGGKLVRTPTYTAEQNSQSRTADVFIEMTGDAKAIVKTIYQGLQYENGNLNFILDNQFDDQKKWVQSNTQIPSFDINSFSIKSVKNRIPEAIVTLDLTLKRYASVSGKRIFITANLMNRSTFIPEKAENRKTSIVRRMAYIDSDTIHYHFPDGLYPEFLPESVNLKSRFGEYEVRYKMDDKGLTYIRRIRMNKGEFPPDSYQELIDFYKSISKADNTKIVFMSKT